MKEPDSIERYIASLQSVRGDDSGFEENTCLRCERPIPLAIGSKKKEKRYCHACYMVVWRKSRKHSVVV